MHIPMATHEDMEVILTTGGYVVVIPNEFYPRAVAAFPTLEEAEDYLTMFESNDED